MNPSGRLFQYVRSTKQNKVLIDKLYFANGVALSPNEDFVVVSETAASQLRRYYLKGAKAGQSDIFIGKLPGASDNLSPDSEGLWVPLVIAIDSENPGIWQSAANVPLIRKFIARILALTELPFKLIENVYPNFYSRLIVHTIGHFDSISSTTPPRATILRIDWNGKIVGSLHGFDKSVHGIAHVLEDNDYLYLGSFANKYLGRVKLPKSYKSAKQTTTTTTQAPTTKQTTTTATTKKPAVTTTEAPTTTTTTQKPKVTSTTAKATTTTTPKPKTTSTTKKPSKTQKPREPAPIHEENIEDVKRPAPEKLKVIKKGGAQGEL